MWCKEVEAANWQGQDARERDDFHKLFHSSCEDRRTGRTRTTVTDLIDDDHADIQHAQSTNRRHRHRA
jgi:hypothetical protein